MADITAGTPLTSRPVTILAMLALVVGVIILLIFLVNLYLKPPVVTQNSDWVLESYRDSTGILIPVIDGTEITARFSNNNILSGKAGCNNYSAVYLTSGKQVAITRATHTQILCFEPGIMQQESAFLEDLPKAAFIQTGGTGMKVLNNESRVILTFRPV